MEERDRFNSLACASPTTCVCPYTSSGMQIFCMLMYIFINLSSLFVNNQVLSTWTVLKQGKKKKKKEEQPPVNRSFLSKVQVSYDPY